MNIKPNVLIFSVFQSSRHINANIAAHQNVLNAMRDSGLPVIELQGKYNGVEELSILIQGFEHRATVERMCKEFSQECYLESHNDRATFLVYPDGRTVSIGTLEPVSKQEAEAEGNYSYNPVVDQYFVTR